MKRNANSIGVGVVVGNGKGRKEMLPKEKIVFDILRKLWSSDTILSQYRLDFPYKYKKHYRASSWRKEDLVTLKKQYVVADFINITKQMIIEVDDTNHSSKNAQREDRAKDKMLTKRGYVVIRIPYDIGFIEGVKKLLKSYKSINRKRGKK